MNLQGCFGYPSGLFQFLRPQSVYNFVSFSVIISYRGYKR